MPSVLHTATATGPGFNQLVPAVRTVYSAEIRFSALPNLRFDQFATRKEELGVQPGRTIAMQKMGGIKRGGYLDEGVRMQARSMSMSETTISVREAGNALAFSEALLQMSFYDNMAAASMLLGRDMAIVLDSQLRDTVRTATTKVYAGGKTSRNALTNSDVFTTLEIHKAVEQLETSNVPKWNNDYYICFVHPHQISTLRQSPGWLNPAMYAGSTPIYFGEIGRFNDVRFISTSMMSNGARAAVDPDTGEYADPGYDPLLDKDVTGALNADQVYQAIMFGEYTFGHAVALPVELRDNGVVDHGREHGLAWYAIWGHGLLEVPNAVIIETA
jgi:N4-gp56 family major capsid protein